MTCSSRKHHHKASGSTPVIRLLPWNVLNLLLSQSKLWIFGSSMWTNCHPGSEHQRFLFRVTPLVSIRCVAIAVLPSSTFWNLLKWPINTFHWNVQMPSLNIPVHCCTFNIFAALCNVILQIMWSYLPMISQAWKRLNTRCIKVAFVVLEAILWAPRCCIDHSLILLFCKLLLHVYYTSVLLLGSCYMGSQSALEKI